MRFIIFLLIFCTPKMILAEKFHLIFTNGMSNTLQDAQLSALQLKLRAQEHFKNLKRNESLLWNPKNSSLAYNFDDTIGREIVELYQQKKKEKDVAFWDWYYETVHQDEEFKKMVLEDLSHCSLEDRIAETLISHLEQFSQQLAEGFDLMIVGHSQGNLFANSLYRRISIQESESAKRLHLLAVATPASYVAGQGPHVTLESDGVIKNLLPLLLKDELLQPLKPNTKNRIPKPGMMDHEFIKHYLEGDRSGEKILRHLRSKLVQKVHAEEPL